MPIGLRTSLYVKDDDYRLSFLHGNYITLTNLDEADFVRIEQQFLTPLYISVHATESAVRVDLMQNPRAGAIMDQLERLVDMGIELHTQAVLAPGRNDGAHLDRTIADLARLYPGVRDLSVVPVGLTRWCHRDLRVYTEAEAADLLDQLLSWQVHLREQLGVGFVYPSDEWFLLAGEPVPERDAYDDLLPAMIENGVGMVRRFLEGQSALEDALSELDARRQTWVTGVLFAPVLARFAEAFTQRTGIEVAVVPVSNHFFGETVTVAGLLTVEDILDALKGIDVGEALVLPAEIFRGPEGRSLDDRTPEDIQAATGRSIYLADRQGHDGETRWSVARF
jgi:putative radical SAM enzyme (TIGR03279 family)